MPHDSDTDTPRGPSGSAAPGATPRPSGAPGLPPMSAPCSIGRRGGQDASSESSDACEADSHAAGRLPLAGEPIVRVRETASQRRSRAYRVERRAVALYSTTFPAGEYYALRLTERRRVLGWLPWTRRIDVFSLYVDRLEPVARAFLQTGHVPAEGLV